MNIAEMWSEGVRNAVYRQQVVTPLVGVLLTGLTAVTMLIAGWAKDARAEEISSGRFVVEVTAASDLGLPMAACEGLTSQQSIVAAGGLYSSAPVTVRNPVTTREVRGTVVSPGVLRVWGLDHTRGAVVGSQLASVSPELGVSVLEVVVNGNMVSLDQDTRFWAPVDALSSSVVIPTIADAPLSVCWISYIPGERDAALAAASSAMGLNPAIVSDFLVHSPGRLTSEDIWNRYVGFGPWIATGLAASAIAGVSLLMRRREVAVMRLTGMRPNSAAMVLLLEHAVGLAVTLPFAFSWGLVVTALFDHGAVTPDAIELAGAYALAAAGAYASATALWCILVSRTDPLRALKQ